MAQLDDLYTALKNADAAGDAASAQKLADYIKTMPSQAPGAQAIHAQNAAWDDKIRGELTGDMNPVQKFVAGYGAAVPAIVRGVGQKLGLVSQADVDESKRLDAPLMNTGAGMAGNITGNVAAALPAAYIPGAASIPGAAAIGGALGLVQPTATGDSSKVLGMNVGSPTVANALTGAGLGAGSVVGGRILGAAYQGGKALIEPFTDAGRTKIAGRMIQRFASDPNSIANVTNAPTITGALPTLAEQTGDAGLARLQDSLRSVDPQINNQIGSRLSDNNAARVSALRTMAGEDGARDFAVAERQGTAQDLYQQAFKNPPKQALTTVQTESASPILNADGKPFTSTQTSTVPTNSGQINDLLQTPAIADARKAAVLIAKNKGIDLNDPAGSIQGLHYMKLAMDDAITAAGNKGTAAGDNLANSIKSAQGRLVGFLDQASPDYAAARKVYADMSKPVNQMDIAAQLARKGLSNGSDLSGNPTVNRNALLGALRDEPGLMQRATGRNLGNSLSGVMEPGQLNMLRAIASETDRAGAVATAGNGPGSATAQRMASQNILRQIVGPTGLPQSWAESALANTVVGKPFNLLYGGVAEPRIQQALAQAVLNPEQARAALAAANAPGFQLPRNALMRLADQARRLTGVSTANATRQP